MESTLQDEKELCNTVAMSDRMYAQALEQKKESTPVGKRPQSLLFRFDNTSIQNRRMRIQQESDGIYEEQHDIKKQVDHLMEYHKWDANQIEAGDHLRNVLGHAIETILMVVPDGPTRTRAINHILDARLLANMAITFKGEF